MKLRRGEILPWTIVAWTLAVSVARGIRLPNDFAEAHWLLDYRFGFMKRGLVGSLCSVAGAVFGFAMTPAVIVGLSAVTFSCLFAALLLINFRALRRHGADGGALLLALVFAASPFIVMNAHLFGYLDTVMYVLAIAAAALALSGRPFLSALVSVVAMLSHESYLLIGFPLVCLASFLQCTGTDRPRWTRHAAAQCLPVIAFAAVVVSQSLILDQAVLRQQLTEYLQSFDFIPTRNWRVAKWHTTGFFPFFLQERKFFGERLQDSTVLASVGPSLLAILYFIHAAFRIRPFGRLSIAILAAIACPLAMHAVAWDTARISTYTLGGAFLVAWILAETRKPQGGGACFVLVALPALILNVFAHAPLMDRQIDQFSNLGRALLYAPALLLALRIALRNSDPSVPASTATEGTPPNTSTGGA